MNWDIEKYSKDIFLIKNTNVLTTKHKNISFDFIKYIFEKLNFFNVPLSYSFCVNKIHFTYLKHNLQGDYCENTKNIRIACNNKYSLKEIALTFIHELGHHVDYLTGMTKSNFLYKEYFRRANLFKHPDIKHHPGEYFAIGFEKFYFNQSLNKHVKLKKTIEKIDKYFKKNNKKILNKKINIKI